MVFLTHPAVVGPYSKVRKASLGEVISWSYPGTQEHLVILLAQGRGFSAARPLGAEAGGSARESPAQPDPPRNSEDPSQSFSLLLGLWRAVVRAP